MLFIYCISASGIGFLEFVVALRNVMLALAGSGDSLSPNQALLKELIRMKIEHPFREILRRNDELWKDLGSPSVLTSDGLFACFERFSRCSGDDYDLNVEGELFWLIADGFCDFLAYEPEVDSFGKAAIEHVRWWGVHMIVWYLSESLTEISVSEAFDDDRKLTIDEISRAKGVCKAFERFVDAANGASICHNARFSAARELPALAKKMNELSRSFLVVNAEA